MEKKLILKLKRNKEDKNFMTLQTEDEKMDVCYFQDFNILLNIFDLIGIDFDEVDKIEATTNLNGLLQLISKCFSVRIDETTAGYTLIVSREKCSKNFNVTKEEGFAKLIVEAENWSQTLIKEIENCCTLKNI